MNKIKFAISIACVFLGILTFLYGDDSLLDTLIAAALIGTGAILLTQAYPKKHSIITKKEGFIYVSSQELAEQMAQEGVAERRLVYPIDGRVNMFFITENINNFSYMVYNANCETGQMSITELESALAFTPRDKVIIRLDPDTFKDVLNQSQLLKLLTAEAGIRTMATEELYHFFR